MNLSPLPFSRPALPRPSSPAVAAAESFMSQRFRMPSLPPASPCAEKKNVVRISSCGFFPKDKNSSCPSPFNYYVSSSFLFALICHWMFFSFIIFISRAFNKMIFFVDGETTNVLIGKRCCSSLISAIGVARYFLM